MNNKGYSALILIVIWPCVAFILVIAFLGILKPVVEWLGTSVYQRNSITFPVVPPKPTSPSTSTPAQKSLRSAPLETYEPERSASSAPSPVFVMAEKSECPLACYSNTYYDVYQVYLS